MKVFFFSNFYDSKNVVYLVETLTPSSEAEKPFSALARQSCSNASSYGSSVCIGSSLGCSVLFQTPGRGAEKGKLFHWKSSDIGVWLGFKAPSGSREVLLTTKLALLVFRIHRIRSSITFEETYGSLGPSYCALTLYLDIQWA